MKVKKYWKITFKKQGYDTNYFVVVRAKTPEKAVQRFYKEYRLRWFESVSEYIIVSVEILKVHVNENI